MQSTLQHPSVSQLSRLHGHREAPLLPAAPALPRQWLVLAVAPGALVTRSGCLPCSVSACFRRCSSWMPAGGDQAGHAAGTAKLCAHNHTHNLVCASVSTCAAHLEVQSTLD